MGCQREEAPEKKVESIYNDKTGRLELLRVDSDGDGKFDMVSHMDGTRFLWIEVDKNEDGIVDRWDYYGPDNKLEKAGFSTRQDGVEDTDGDGAIDRWDTYDNGRVASVAFDTKHRGKPDRRFIYHPDGTFRLEEDPRGTGHFVTVTETHTPNPLAVRPSNAPSARAAKTQ
jgi:hypothetical protein